MNFTFYLHTSSRVWGNQLWHIFNVVTGATRRLYFAPVVDTAFNALFKASANA